MGQSKGSRRGTGAGGGEAGSEAAEAQPSADSGAGPAPGDAGLPRLAPDPAVSIYAQTLRNLIQAIATEIGLMDINHSEAVQVRRNRALALQRELDGLTGAKQ